MNSIFCFWICTMTLMWLNSDCFDDYYGYMHLYVLRLLPYICFACDNICSLIFAKNTKEVLPIFLIWQLLQTGGMFTLIQQRGELSQNDIIPFLNSAPTEQKMEPFHSSNFPEPNTGSEPFHALGMEPSHSVPPSSRTEHILSSDRLKMQRRDEDD
jgi:hypothetical protein